MRSCAHLCVFLLGAGFVAGPAFAQDVTPPAVVSLSYAVTPPAYSEAASPAVIAAGARITLDLTASEAVSRAFLNLSGPTTITFNRTGGTGTRVLWVLDFPSTPPAGSYAASVDLIDAAGNIGRVSIALPAPGFVVTNGVDSPCLMQDTAGASLCTDADGDGAPGRSAVCDLGGDCDDTNPTIRAFSPEIPGDGVDNACLGRSDAPVVEATGIFVAPRPTGGGVGANGTVTPVTSPVWYDYAASCTLYQDDDGSLYFWDATGRRGNNDCRTFNANLIDPSRDAATLGACWVPIFAKSPNGSAIVTPIAALGPSGASSEVAFSGTCTGNTGACTVSWRPRSAQVTANLGTGAPAASRWYTGAATVTVTKPNWGAACPAPGSASDFTWSPPGLGTEDPSCTECDGTRAVWTMNRAAQAEQKWQYVNNPHAHPTVVIVHEGNMQTLWSAPAGFVPDAQSTIASEHWPMYTLAVRGNLQIANGSTVVIGAGTKENGFPSIIVDGNFQMPTNSRLVAGGNAFVRGNVNGPERLLAFGEALFGSDVEDGTRAHPFRTLRRGIEAARPVNKVVFVALGAYDDGGPGLVIDVPLIGGFVSPGWQRVPLAHSFAALNNPAQITSDLVMGFDLDIRAGGALVVQPARASTLLLDDRVIGDPGDRVALFGAVRSVRTDVDGASLDIRGTLVTSRGTFTGNVRSTNATLFQRTIFGGSVDVASGTFVGTRAVFEGPVTAAGASVSRLSQSTFLEQAQPAINAASALVVTITNSVFAGTAPDVILGAGTITLERGNLFEGTCPVLRADGTCAPVCGVNGNLCQAAGLVPGDFHLAAGSAAINAGTFQLDLTPTSSVLDLDGQCIAGGTDLGADER